jgi:hypothetical protein
MVFAGSTYKLYRDMKLRPHLSGLKTATEAFYVVKQSFRGIFLKKRTLSIKTTFYEQIQL